MGVIQIKSNMTRRQKYLAKVKRVFILVINVIYGETWFHYLGGIQFPILHTYPLNELMMGTQLSVDLG